MLTEGLKFGQKIETVVGTLWCFFLDPQNLILWQSLAYFYPLSSILKTFYGENYKNLDFVTSYKMFSNDLMFCSDSIFSFKSMGGRIKSQARPLEGSTAVLQSWPQKL